MNVVVVYNPKSGNAQTKRQLSGLFKAANIVVDSYVTLDDSLSNNLLPLCRKNAVIATIGGDGTIATVAAIVSTTSATLAPLPGGTLNHFTKDAGINQDLALAIKDLRTAKKRAIDVAMVNGRLFLNNSSIGIYPTTLVTRKHFEDKLGKWPSAVISTIRAFVRFRIYTVKMKDTIYRTPFVFVGNNFYDIDNAAIRTKLNSKKLCVYIVKSDKRIAVLRILISSLLGRARDDNELICLTPQKLTIHVRKKRLRISTDGELAMIKTPISYEIKSGALAILSSSVANE
jgi:diacylglycerol kinase family enzyme